MEEVIEYLFNRQINGKVIMDSELKEKIDGHEFKRVGIASNNETFDIC
jgi:hypothetical protein